ncbi:MULTISPECIES: acyl-CoA dehydrogenase family protein [unclassified Okeania]|uniref:acyl-CoA dehydrogenase family protein n=1 Tax=unclassified Okeania TaxID=2634635 RepID=UPI0013B9D6C7|nr:MULTISPECIES: acyl-CoA dehydrogenase family protein [unclassified Okeania]NEP74564.1 acyl-CoA/acyl-ACP dehydrogenase [Okeania sp. SIO2G5]NEP95625.1 acyl-CoA/acyl-ACP dehydrogenase [Okeania sp. SIO2F5]NEQ92673.1 acyl-CoA/acyl-ACP dehydrogenase [Okeania sp. SIO2G4]NES78245.1 acyl-CoA/acyl-ACP dehydrogenase [Okeania sp. SIO1H4]NES92109.1 acyl-CoA/acyl-ACP dehydrogenase [Okeania sp. SIO2B9]
MTISHLLKTTKIYLETDVYPRSNEIDFSPELLYQALDGLGKLGVLTLRVSQQWGGIGMTSETFVQFQELVARYSGALAFLQTQHQSASAMLMQSSNTQLQEVYLPKMSDGKIKIGVGFSQIRRTGNPTITAIPVEGGYHINGYVPWVSGWQIFDQFIVAATLADGQAVFGLVPFQNSEQISFSQPMSLCAMTSTNTVTATLNHWFLPAEKVVSIQPIDWIHQRDQKNALPASFLALGCAKAGLDILETVFEQKKFIFIQDATELLNQELNQCRAIIQKAQQNSNLDIDQKYQLRAWAIDLALRCAHAAVTSSSGGANLSHHHAQRVYREALVFTVSGQNQSLMAATLNRLSRQSSL